MSDFSLGPLPFHDEPCRDTGARYRGGQRQCASDGDGDVGDVDDDGGGGGGNDGLNFFVQLQPRSQRIVTADRLSPKFTNHDHDRAPRVQG